MDNKEFNSCMNDDDNFIENNCGSGEDYVNFSEDGQCNNDSMPFVNNGANGFNNCNCNCNCNNDSNPFVDNDLSAFDNSGCNSDSMSFSDNGFNNIDCNNGSNSFMDNDLSAFNNSGCNNDSNPFVNDGYNGFNNIDCNNGSNPFVNDGANGFNNNNCNNEVNNQGQLSGCSNNGYGLDGNNNKCESNGEFGEYIGEVEMDDRGSCGQHEDQCCKHGNYENKACFEQDGNCEDDCFKPRKKHPKCAHLKVYKYVDRSYALDGETLKYCIKIENTGNTTAFNIKLRDILPMGLNFINNSLRVSGCNRCYKGTLSNLSLGSLEPCKSIKISYEARIACGTSGAIRNIASVIYCYATSRCGDIKCDRTRSTVARTNVARTPITMTNEVNKNVVSVGEDIVYRIGVTNNGAARVDNFTLRDELSCALCCKEVKVGNRNYPCNRLASGIDIGALNPCETKYVCITARVQDFPRNGVINNFATGRFNRNGQPLCPIRSNNAALTVVLYMCRPATVEDKVRVSCSNGPVHTVTDAVANVKVLDVKEDKSCDCGYDRYKKVHVSGIINLCIKYDTCSGCEKKIIRKVPFCMNIKVPRNFVYNKNYCITIEPKEICTKICCGFEIATTIKLIIRLVSL